MQFTYLMTSHFLFWVKCYVIVPCVFVWNESQHGKKKVRVIKIITQLKYSFEFIQVIHNAFKRKSKAFVEYLHVIYYPWTKLIFFHACSHKVPGGQVETSEASLALDLNSHTVTFAYFPLFKASHFSMPQINGQESILLP